MVSVRALLIVLLLVSMAGSAERTLFQIGVDLSHSPQLSRFYQEMLRELEFRRNGDLNDDDNQTLLYRNSSTETTLFCNFSYGGGEIGRADFTPVIAADLGYKRLKYQSWGWSIIVPEGSYAHMMKWKFLLGVIPEFSFSKGGGRRYRRFVLKPEVKAGPVFLLGSFDNSAFFLMRSGCGTAWEFGKTGGGAERAFSVGLGVFGEFVLSDGNRCGAVYGRVLDRRIIYPEKSVNFAFTMGYSIRRKRERV